MRNVCTQAKSILTSFILQVIDQPVSNWVPLGVGSASQSQACSQTCPCYALLVNSVSLELGASQLACCSEVFFPLKGAPWVLSLVCQARSLSQERKLCPQKKEAEFRLCLAEDQFEIYTDCIPGAFHLFCFHLCEYRKSNSVKRHYCGEGLKLKSQRQNNLGPTTEAGGTQDFIVGSNKSIQVEGTLYIHFGKKGAFMVYTFL